MDYTSYVVSLSTMMAEQDTTDANFVAILPDIIAYAEGRMYRDLDMIGTRFSDTSQTLIANSRDMTLPSQTLVTEGVRVIVSSTVSSQLVPTTREFLDWSYPTVTGAGIPLYFAITGQLTGIVGPWSGSAYSIEVTGISTPTALSSTNTTTLLTTQLPETFLACSMIVASGYQKNFGAQADDPQQAQSWEQQYKSLMQSAAVYELRKRFQSEAWTSKSPNPVATPARV